MYFNASFASNNSKVAANDVVHKRQRSFTVHDKRLRSSTVPDGGSNISNVGKVQLPEINREFSFLSR